MHYAILPVESALYGEAAALARAGKLSLLDALPSLDALTADDFVVLHAALVAPWLGALTDRCRGGLLGAIRIVVESSPPPWERIGFRVRPWVQSIHLLGDHNLVEARAATTPAPLVQSTSLAAVLEDFTRPAFRPEEIPTAFPPKIQIETTAFCAVDCPFCPISTRETRDRTRMTDALFAHIIGECSAGRPDTIELYLNGDPLTDPRMEHLADVAKAANPTSLIEIITHERSITRKRAPALAASGLDAVFVSVNIEAAVDLAAMRARLERVAALREVFLARGKQLVVVTLANLLEASRLAQFEAIAAELGVPVERFRATARMGDVDLAHFAVGGAARTPAARVCERPFTKAYVRATGDVLLCCEDWNDRWVMGNVAVTPLAEIWASALYRARRRALLDGRLEAPCAGCEYAGPVEGARPRVSLKTLSA